MKPCESCKINNKPNCGNDYCHTNRTEDVWIVDCNLCGAKNESSWKQAVNERNACCGTFDSQIYHRTTLEKEQSKREI